MLGFIFGDITKLRTDAIVNAANTSLLGGGGVDGAIHRAAGPELLEECRKFHGCNTGEARITKGWRLPAKFVIHTPGPVWNGGGYGEEELLRACYRNSLALCRDNRINSVAFPLISGGVYGYPKDQAISVAIDEIEKYLRTEDIEAYICLFSKRDLSISEELEEQLREYRMEAEPFLPSEPKPSFPEIISSLLEEKKMKFGEVYKRSNMTREECNDCLTHLDFVPDRNTVIKASFGLELSASETLGYLRHYGFSFSADDRRDSVIAWFMENGIWSVPRLNAALLYLSLNPV